MTDGGLAGFVFLKDLHDVVSDHHGAEGEVTVCYGLGGAHKVWFDAPVTAARP